MDKSRKWTVLVYLAGDNNLSPEMIYALLQMQDSGVDPQKDAAVVVQFDPQGKGLPTQRYVINGGSGDKAAAMSRLQGGNMLTRNIGHLTKDALLAKEEVDKFEDVIFPSLLGILRKKRKSLPILTASAGFWPKEKASEIQKKLAPAFAENAGHAAIANLKRGGELLPAFTNQKLTEDTGNPWVLLRFLLWGVTAFPADKYMVVLSGHGSGTMGDFLRDDSSGKSLTVRELGEAMLVFKEYLTEQVGKQTVDILGFDSCLMSMAEVCCELKGAVDYIVGAEGFEPNAGWPYKQVLNLLAQNPDIEPAEYAKAIVSLYNDYYFDYAFGGVSVDLAACDIRSEVFGGLTSQVKNLSHHLCRSLEDEKKRDSMRDAILLAHWEAQTYKFDQYVDLYDFCDLLAHRSSGMVAECCRRITEHMDAAVILNQCTSGPIFQYSHGISLYFPWAEYDPRYQYLKFAEETAWHEFLALFIGEGDGDGVSRRLPRYECQTRHAALRKILNPDLPPGDLAPGVEKEPAEGTGKFGGAYGRYTKPADRYTKPADRGPEDRSTLMKNPPIRWGPPPRE